MLNIVVGEGVLHKHLWTNPCQHSTPLAFININYGIVSSGLGFFPLQSCTATSHVTLTFVAEQASRLLALYLRLQLISGRAASVPQIRFAPEIHTHI